MGNAPGKPVVLARIPQGKMVVVAEPKEYFIKKGPLGEILYQKVENGLHFYVKKNLSLRAIENYKWASKKGVGPPIASVNYFERSVKIEAGINPIVAINKRMLKKQTAILQVELLRAILKNRRRAHCDVKMDNCLYFVNFGRIFLIDNGEITDYGQLRLVKTPGENTTMLGKGQIAGVVSCNTDEKGFNNIIQALSWA